MTTDELVLLMEGIAGKLDIYDVRRGADHLPEYVSDLGLDEWLLLVRFLAGERPSGTGQPTAPLRAVERNLEGNEDGHVAGRQYDPHEGNKLGEIRLF